MTNQDHSDGVQFILSPKVRWCIIDYVVKWLAAPFQNSMFNRLLHMHQKFIRVTIFYTQLNDQRIQFFKKNQFRISTVFVYIQLNVKKQFSFKLFSLIKYTVWMSNSSIWHIHRNLQGNYSKLEWRNGNKRVLFIPQSITEVSPSNCLLSYLGHSLGESYTPAEMQSVYPVVPSPLAKGMLRTMKLIEENIKSKLADHTRLEFQRNVQL